jgi:hypothetical protein
MHPQLNTTLNQLQALANPQKALYKAQQFGIHAEQTLAIYRPKA